MRQFVIASMVCVIVFSSLNAGRAYSPVPVTATIASETTVAYSEASAFVERGYKAFVEKKYDEALRWFRLVEQYVSEHPEHKKYFDHHYRGFSMIDVIEQHRKFADVTPVRTHKVLVFYINKTDTEYEGIKIKEKFTDAMRQKARLAQQVSARYIETLSRGQMTLSFTEIEQTSTLKRVIALNSGDHGVTTIHADLESVDPHFAELLLKKYNRFDTVLFYWPAEALKNTDKGRATAMGGEANLPLVPYIMYGAKRGRVVISSNLAHQPGTLLHEIFHTLEKRYGIAVIHGFRDANRHHFNNWHGNTEYDYYRHHFDTTFKKAGYAKFEYSESFQNKVKVDEYKKIKQLARKVSIDNRKKAHDLYNEAVKHQHHDKSRAKKLFNKAVKLNPFHARVLHQLCVISHQEGNKNAAFEYITRAHELAPYDAYILYWMGVEHFHRGNLKEAVGYFNESIKNEENNAAAWQYRGFVNYKLGRYQHTYRDYKRVMSMTGRFNGYIKKFLTGRARSGDAAAKDLLIRLGL